ncbi:DNA-protecting protein DprA [Panacibacter sp. DH6]|uniref:DNA-protecting protein DprA n=1 Tax=Panacibacter microcysteis TaxID=2793269 RepID=A0A931E0G9_9BACT|nr:DNA-processing protein DprA [Panacibacter microcysteis]MBG9374823.1 DNA-protecting protein DprA [Panacibacter microcysteis]
MCHDTLYQVALTMVPNIGAVQAKALIEHFGSAEAVFKASASKLGKVDLIGEVRAAAVKNFTQFNLAEDELLFIEKYKIQTFFIKDKDYPQRLLKCIDAPVLLYYRGNADLNHAKIISIIGTRTSTDYGKQVTEKLVEDLREQHVLVLSGLAFGIDAIAHRAALANGLPTIGVLAHGLDNIYPPQHKALAKDMMLQGGLLTEFTRYTKADRHNFPRRNRIVAGMADATIVVETAIKGGSMITAELAHNYGRDVFACPGRIIDAKSAGCNYLIKNNHATLLTDAQQFAEKMGWQKKNNTRKVQKELFIELSADEQTIVNLLSGNPGMHIDELLLKSNLSTSAIAAGILSLELQNVVISMPGKMYRLA